jgi:hypothetical protein
MTLEKPLSSLDAATLEQTHKLLGKMMVDNERRLGTKEVMMRWVLVIGVIATVVGLIFDNRQPPSPTPVVIVTPTPTPWSSPSPSPSPIATTKARAASNGVVVPLNGSPGQRGSDRQVEHHSNPVVSSTGRGTK